MGQPTKTILVIKNEIAGKVCEEERPKYSNIVLILDEALLGRFSSARKIATKLTEEGNRCRQKEEEPLVTDVLLYRHIQGRGFYCSDSLLVEHKIDLPRRIDGEFPWFPVVIKESSLEEMKKQQAYTSGMSLLIGGCLLPSWPFFQILNKGKHEEKWHQLISQDVTWKELWELVDEYDKKQSVA
jgi:hypothetical protein